MNLPWLHCAGSHQKQSRTRSELSIMSSTSASSSSAMMEEMRKATEEGQALLKEERAKAEQRHLASQESSLKLQAVGQETNELLKQLIMSLHGNGGGSSSGGTK